MLLLRHPELGFCYLWLAVLKLSMMEAAAAKSLQSCPTLCDPIDGSPPDSPIPGILQARTLEWVADSKPMPFPLFILPPWVYLFLVQKALVLYGNRKFVSIHEWIRRSYSTIQSIQSLNVRAGRDLRDYFSLITLSFYSWNNERLREGNRFV